MAKTLSSLPALSAKLSATIFPVADTARSPEANLLSRHSLVAIQGNPIGLNLIECIAQSGDEDGITGTLGTA